MAINQTDEQKQLFIEFLRARTGKESPRREESMLEHARSVGTKLVPENYDSIVSSYNGWASLIDGAQVKSRQSSYARRPNEGRNVNSSNTFS